MAQSMKTGTRYLVEVKTGKGTAATSLKALEQGEADGLLYLKGDTKGGVDGKIETLPIFYWNDFILNKIMHILLCSYNSKN